MTHTDVLSMVIHHDRVISVFLKHALLMPPCYINFLESIWTTDNTADNEVGI